MLHNRLSYVYVLMYKGTSEDLVCCVDGVGVEL
jgi:hypothetical protein